MTPDSAHAAVRLAAVRLAAISATYDYLTDGDGSITLKIYSVSNALLCAMDIPSLTLDTENYCITLPKVSGICSGTGKASYAVLQGKKGGDGDLLSVGESGTELVISSDDLFEGVTVALSDDPEKRLLLQHQNGNDLVFGDVLRTSESALVADYLPSVPDISVDISASVELSALLAADYIPAVPALGVTFGAYLDYDLPDGGVGFVSRQQQAKAVAAGVSVEQQQADIFAKRNDTRQQQAEPIQAGAGVKQSSADKLQSKAAERYQQAIPVQSRTTLPHSETGKIRRRIAEIYAQAIPVQTRTTLSHAEQIRTRNTIKETAQQAIPAQSRLHIDHHHGRLVPVDLAIRWTEAIPPPTGYWQGELPPAPPVPAPPDNGDKIHLLFDKLNSANLLFGRQSATDYIAGKEAYIVSNTFEMRRASDNEPIECSAFNASIDVDSWGWSWSASIPAALQSLIEPENGDPVEVIVTLNGFELRLMVERMSRERKFPDAWLSISGRGRSAWLAEPYDMRRAYDNEGAARTANQLAEDALTVNGVPIGWAVDWQIDDWLVPAGAWHHQGAYIDAVTRIAEAAGAYVQADDTDKVLHVLPRYPAMPRDWGGLDVDVAIPEDVCETESVEWLDKADYNAVWVVGGADGRKDKIVLTGSAGDRPAQTVVDDLMTDSDVTRQRGIRVLADTGRQAIVTLRLPIMPAVGVVKVGDVVDYTEQGATRRGINRGLQLQYNYPQAWQTLRIETHV